MIDDQRSTEEYLLQSRKSSENGRSNMRVQHASTASATIGEDVGFVARYAIREYHLELLIAQAHRICLWRFQHRLHDQLEVGYVDLQLPSQAMAPVG